MEVNKNQNGSVKCNIDLLRHTLQAYTEIHYNLDAATCRLIKQNYFTAFYRYVPNNPRTPEALLA
jgi:hypothetical protein